MTIRFVSKGDWGPTRKWLTKAEKLEIQKILDDAGQRGVDALRSATPVDTGKTAAGWYYKIKRGIGRTEIHWCNSNINQGVNIAVILQYGHGVNHGGWVEGRDYINPAVKPIFDKIADEAVKELMKDGGG